MKKTIDTLVNDIYAVIEPLTENKKINISEEDIEINNGS